MPATDLEHPGAQANLPGPPDFTDMLKLSRRDHLCVEDGLLLTGAHAAVGGFMPCHSFLGMLLKLIVTYVHDLLKGEGTPGTGVVDLTWRNPMELRFPAFGKIEGLRIYQPSWY